MIFADRYGLFFRFTARGRMPVPGEYFEARERALLGTRYDVLYAASCAVRRGVTVNGLRCAPQEFAAAVDFGLEPSPFL